MKKEEKITIEELYKLAVSMFQKNKIKYTEDDIQTVVFHAYQKIKKFDSTKANKTTFFYKVMWNEFWNIKKSEKTQKRGSGEKPLSLNKYCKTTESEKIEICDLIPDNVDYSEEKMCSLVYKEFEKIVKPMLKKETIMWLEGIPKKEIAKIFDVSVSAVGSKINKNLNKVRETLKKQNIYERYENYFSP